MIRVSNEQACEARDYHGAVVSINRSMAPKYSAPAAPKNPGYFR